MFDEKTIQSLKYYVYALIDSSNNKPFYIGKGVNNRVFDHVNNALEVSTSNDKLDLIRDLKERNIAIKHIIIRHGLTESVAFQIEASLIDSLRYFDYSLVNVMNGHHSIDKGLMTADEIIRLNNAEELNEIDGDAVIININRLYKRGSGYDGIYNAVRECWPIPEDKRKIIRYVLCEYKGLIAEIFNVEEWYPVNDKYKSGKQKGQLRIRWGFKGSRAEDSTRNKYINKTIAHHKKRGAANPVRYNLSRN